MVNGPSLGPLAADLLFLLLGLKFGLALWLFRLRRSEIELEALGEVSLDEIVLDKVRDGAPTLCPVGVVGDPIFHTLRDVRYLVLGVHIGDVLPVEDPALHFVKLLVGREDRRTIAKAMRVPTPKLEILWILALEVVADIRGRVPAGEVYLVSDDKRELVPTGGVGLPVSHIDLGPGESHCIFIRGPVNALARVESLGPL